MSKIRRRPQNQNLLACGTYRGYDWRVQHNRAGFRCGYVRIPRKHPWWHVDYQQLNSVIEVHGGITFAEKGLPGRVPNFSYRWWIGFDCAHAYDAPDPELIPLHVRKAWDMLAEMTGTPNMFDVFSKGNVVRTQEYVEDECIQLIQQAIAAAE